MGGGASWLAWHGGRPATSPPGRGVCAGRGGGGRGARGSERGQRRAGPRAGPGTWQPSRPPESFPGGGGARCGAAGGTMNVFRILGDLSHLLAMILLLGKIWRSKSCAGEGRPRRWWGGGAEVGLGRAAHARLGWRGWGRVGGLPNFPSARGLRLGGARNLFLHSSASKENLKFLPYQRRAGGERDGGWACASAHPHLLCLGIAAAGGKRREIRRK